VIGRLHELTAVVADAWPTIADAIAGLQAIDQWGRRHDDARGCFAAAYRIVTVAVDAALRDDDFGDPAWVTRVVLDFAGRYRLAVSAAAHGLPAPRCWAAALRHPHGGSIPAIVALLHAMIAHIPHDLAHTLGACAPIDRHRAADYERLGVVICRATLAIQRELVAAYVPDLRGLHTALRGADTWLTVTLVRAWRARARTVAGRMVASPGHAVAWSRRLERESTTLAAALDILTARLPRRPRPAWIDRPLTSLIA
jgi:hypothetical protein